MGFVELDSELLKSVKKETGVNYQNVGVFVPLDSVSPMLQDLLCEIDRLKEKLGDEVEQRKNYYKPKSHMEIEGVPESGPID